MMAKQANGRMINQDISDSAGFAALSSNAAVLFCMLIPHFSAHGKQSGGPAYIKEVVCPLIPYLTLENIPGLMAEIATHTNVKWFEARGRHWLHALNFLSKHQKLKAYKLGRDKLPDYSGTTPGLLREYSGNTPELVPPEVEVEVEVEEEEESITTLSQKESETDTIPPPALLFDHVWGKLLAIFPKRNGKIQDLDACREKFRRMPAAWNQVLRGAKNYAQSKEVADGVVMNLMTFLLKRRWFDWQGEPLGDLPPPDYSWKKNLEADERALADFDAAVAAGTIITRPRDRLPFENLEDYQKKLDAGTLPRMTVKTEKDIAK